MIAFYHGLLRLYPASFFIEFGEEMTEVFAQGLHDAHQHGFVTYFCLREFMDLPMNILREHLIQLRNFRRTPYQMARDITRTASLVCVFIYYSASANTLTPDRGLGYQIFFALNIIPLLGLLLAWRWERIGGLLATVGALPVSLWVCLGAYDMSHNVLLAVFSGVVYSLLYALFGGMFVWLSFRQFQKRKVMAD